MNKVTLKIKVLLDEMGKAEKKVAHWILEHPGEILPLSIVELAEKAICSEATIVRFSQHLGFTGYQELKIALARETKSTIVNAHMTAEDSAFEIYEKVCNDIYCSLERTKKVLDADVLQSAADAIMAAGKIIVIGLGNSASVAIDAGHKLLRAGYTAFAYTDNHMQMIAAAHLSPGDVAIGISHSGSSKDVIEAMQTAREHGATTICITNKGKSPIQKHSDLVLYTSSEETQYNILALNSRIAQLSIIDALYFHIVYQQSPKTLSSIEDTESSLKTKKY
ncbi:MAG: MurR/RpiR family transcriptional regulator [Clostridia bacterium]|nr:MurR/RpiR family transcriptional regulator [Clostridia bacterium]